MEIGTKIPISILLIGNTSLLVTYKQFTLDTRANRGLMHRDLFINSPHTDYIVSLWKPDDGHYRPKYVVSFIRIQHLSKEVVLLTTLPLISYAHNGDDTP